jgi:hypothetical protein
MDDAERIRRLTAERDELRERVRQLEENATGLLVAPGAFGLTPTEGRIVSALMRVEFLHHERMQVLFPDLSRDSIKTYMCRIRGKLAVHGVEVGCLYGAGYMINPDHKHILSAAPPAPSVKGQRGQHAHA